MGRRGRTGGEEEREGEEWREGLQFGLMERELMGSFALVQCGGLADVARRACWGGILLHGGYMAVTCWGGILLSASRWWVGDVG